MHELIETVTTSERGQRLDAFWQSCLDEEGVARTRIQHWIRDGRARINGQVCTKPSVRVIPGQVMTLEPEYPESELVADPSPLSVVFSDVHLAVVDKEAGLTVHPAPSVSESTLVHRALHRFPTLRSQAGPRPGVVHRLDKNTSGLLLLALSESARLSLIQAFANREIRKEYLAVVAGVPGQSGRISLPLDRHPTIKTRMAVAERGGREAETLYRVLWTSPDKSASLLGVRILTGRTHQIRVHMAAIGHPLLGDEVYAGREVASRAPRQMLHAWRLGLVHPATGERIRFRSRPPEDFLAVLAGLCRQSVRIGLTGVAGSGKSVVSRAVEASGVPVFCADRAVGEAYRPGGQGAEVLRYHFGSRFLAEDGSVDRAVLLLAMAESDSLRREVERLVHPLVKDGLDGFFRHHDREIMLADIPLLCESGMSGALDVLAVVFCPENVRRQRLRERGWSAERIDRVDSWQWSQDKKVRMGHLVLDNSGSLQDLEAKAGAMVRIVRAMALARADRRMRSLLAICDADPLDDSDEDYVSPA